MGVRVLYLGVGQRGVWEYGFCIWVCGSMVSVSGCVGPGGSVAVLVRDWGILNLSV